MRPILNITLFIIILSLLSFYISSGMEIKKSEIENPSSGTELITQAYLPSILNNYPLANPFGVTLYPIDATHGLDALVTAKTHWTRIDLTWWSIVQPEENNPYTWDPSFDQELINANNAHIQPVVIIGGTPTWALKELFYPCGPVAENKFAQLAQFAAAAGNRYSIPPYNVKYWELYNEPDVAGTLGCWGDTSDAQFFGGYYYGQMLQVVYPVIKAANPAVQVMVGGLLLDCDPISPPENKNCLPSKFLEGILMSGAGPYFDGVSFHAYDFFLGKGMFSNSNWHSSWNTTGPVLIVKANYLKTLLTNYGQGQKFLLASETALFYGPNQWNPLCVADAPADLEVTKAYFLIESYAATVANGYKANIWYSAFGVRCSGLLQVDLNPLPAYYAYQFAAQKLVGAIYIRNVTEYPGVMGYEYMVAGQGLWVLWSLDGNSHNIILASTPIMVNHIGEDGKPVQETNSPTLTIDLSPRFIDFAK